MSLQDCYSVHSTDDNIAMLSALESTGYLGTTPCSYVSNPLEAYFELHIEQGPKLEQTGRKVGVVTGIQGMQWFSVRVSGIEGHSGTAPMEGRSDALVTASKMIAAVNTVALGSKLGVATVGVISNDTQSQSTIPSGVDFIIDVRCSTDAMVTALSTAIFAQFDQITTNEGNSTTYAISRRWGLPESVFQKECIEVVRAAAVEEVGDDMIMEMKSGAGHDAGWASKVVNSTMIFVPSKDGVSHNPAEYTSPEDCALGAQVLLQAVLRYDEGLRSGAISIKQF
jgi:hydantoinase/carbamoylase family amidase